MASSAASEETMAPGRPTTEQQRMPSFLKVMVGDFKTRVKIPTKFIRQIKKKPPSCSILRGANGTKYWYVEVKKSQDEFFFQNGWPQFVRDNSLETDDFVVFHCDNDLNFDVFVFGNDHCEKGITQKKKLQQKVENKQGKEQPPFLCNCKYIPARDTNGELIFDAESCQYKLSNPHFVSVMTTHVQNRVPIPKTLGRECGLWPSLGKKASCVRDPNGRTWSVNLVTQCRRKGLGAFSGGWSKVAKENKLVGGDSCILEVVRKGDSKKPSIVSLHIPRGGRLGKLEPQNVDSSSSSPSFS